MADGSDGLTKVRTVDFKATLTRRSIFVYLIIYIYSECVCKINNIIGVYIMLGNDNWSSLKWELSNAIDVLQGNSGNTFVDTSALTSALCKKVDVLQEILYRMNQLESE